MGSMKTLLLCALALFAVVAVASAADHGMDHARSAVSGHGDGARRSHPHMSWWSAVLDAWSSHVDDVQEALSDHLENVEDAVEDHAERMQARHKVAREAAENLREAAEDHHEDMSRRAREHRKAAQEAVEDHRDRAVKMLSTTHENGRKLLFGPHKKSWRQRVKDHMREQSAAHTKAWQDARDAHFARWGGGHHGRRALLQHGGGKHHERVAKHLNDAAERWSDHKDRRRAAHAAAVKAVSDHMEGAAERWRDAHEAAVDHARDAHSRWSDAWRRTADWWSGHKADARKRRQEHRARVHKAVGDHFGKKN